MIRATNRVLTLWLWCCSLHVQASAAALSLLKGRLPGRFPTDLTGLWTGLAEDRKWRKDVAEALLRARLLNGPDMDAHLSKVLQLSRSSTQAVEFAVHLVRPALLGFFLCLFPTVLWVQGGDLLRENIQDKIWGMSSRQDCNQPCHTKRLSSRAGENGDSPAMQWRDSDIRLFRFTLMS